MFRRAAAHEGPLQGVNVRIKDDGVEVPDDNGESGQDGLVVVDGGGDVEPDLEEVFKHVAGYLLQAKLLLTTLDCEENFPERFSGVFTCPIAL